MNPVPSTPDVTWNALAYTLIRALFMAASTAGVYHGTVSDSMLQIYAGAIVMLGTAIWGVYDKIQAAKKAHDGSVTSANAGKAYRIM